MLSERLSLKVNSMLRRAGLADVPRGVLVCVAVLCVVLVVWALWRFWPAASADSEDFAVQTEAEQEAGEVEQGAAQEDADQIFVDVEGAIANPGVYELEPDARVNDAVEAAGGFTDKASRQSVNLAEKLEDGMQVYVQTKAEAQSSGSSSGSPGSSSTGSSSTGSGASSSTEKINLNTATAEELQELSGIGPSLSQRIIDYREAHGGFASIDELKEVSGIGDVRYEAVKDYVCV